MLLEKVYNIGAVGSKLVAEAANITSSAFF